jgi:hypothetical protein
MLISPSILCNVFFGEFFLQWGKCVISVHGVYEQVLFNDTILHNIAYGRPSATQEQVVQAAKQAVIAAFMLCFKPIFRLIVCVPVQVLERCMMWCRNSLLICVFHLCLFNSASMMQYSGCQMAMPQGWESVD